MATKWTTFVFLCCLVVYCIYLLLVTLCCGHFTYLIMLWLCIPGNNSLCGSIMLCTRMLSVYHFLILLIINCFFIISVLFGALQCWQFNTISACLKLCPRERGACLITVGWLVIMMNEHFWNLFTVRVFCQVQLNYFFHILFHVENFSFVGQFKKKVSTFCIWKALRAKHLLCFLCYDNKVG